nr:hypothetical protein L203_02886 [Cryptococcus depauperatus CBS 7841]
MFPSYSGQHAFNPPSPGSFSPPASQAYDETSHVWGTADSMPASSSTTQALTPQDAMLPWQSNSSSGNPMYFLVLDTNVLIKHLNLVRTLHAVLAAIQPPGLLLLVPFKVIQEIDGLQSSSKLPHPDSPVDVGRLARVANSWLLETHRERRQGGPCAVRCQSLAERYDHNVIGGKGDDEILDCCLYYKSQGARVVLWTDDKNLRLKSESNDIVTLGCQNLTLSNVLKHSGANIPEKSWREIQLLETRGSLSNKNALMYEDVDVDMVDDNVRLEKPLQPARAKISQSAIKSRYFADLPPVISSSTGEIVQVHTPPKPDDSHRFYPYLPTDADTIDIDRDMSSATPITPNRPSLAPTRYLSSGQASPFTKRPTRLMLTSLCLSFLRPTISLLSHPTLNAHLSPICPTSLQASSVLPTLFSAISSMDRVLSAEHAFDTAIRLSVMDAQAGVKVIQQYVEYHGDSNGGRGMREVKTAEMMEAVKKLEKLFWMMGIKDWNDAEILDEFKNLE